VAGYVSRRNESHVFADAKVGEMNQFRQHERCLATGDWISFTSLQNRHSPGDYPHSEVLGVPP